MHRINQTLIFLAVLAALSACSNGNVGQPAESDDTPISTSPPAVTFTPNQDAKVERAASGKPSGPISVAFRIIGKPVVGQPLAVDLRVTSTLGPQPIDLSYRINDAGALQLAESQAPFVKMTPGIEEPTSSQQVTIIPLREGRLYLNVSASVETENGSMSTVTAIPIQVGDAPRKYHDNGVIATDEQGEAIRSVPAKED
jgi:hypothetical protein